MSDGESPIANRRKDGWTWAKEIVGTMVGVAGVLVIPGSWLYTTIDSLKLANEVSRIEIAALKEAKKEQAERSEKIVDSIGKVLEAVNEVRVQQARASAGLPK